MIPHNICPFMLKRNLKTMRLFLNIMVTPKSFNNKLTVPQNRATSNINEQKITKQKENK